MNGRSVQRGASTVYFLLFTFVIFGLLVMATDFGRLYLIQAELQTAADAAALAAATRLVGTVNASLHAGDQVTASFDSTTGNDNRFNLRMNQIGASGGSGLLTEISVDYFSTLQDAVGNINGGQGGGIDWGSGAYPKYARVQISAQAPVLFLPLLNRISGSLPTVTVSAIAGLSAPACTASGIDGVAIVDQSGAQDPLHYGLTPGNFYTLSLTSSQAPLEATDFTVPYVILDHFPSGAQDLDLDGLLFELAAGGISNNPELNPPGSITVDSIEIGYPNGIAALQGSTNTAGQDILCGLNVRFGVDPSQYATCGNPEFAELAALFRADADAGAETYQAGAGLQDFATEYDGSLRRVLTVPVVDAADSLSVLNFRQFLIETSSTVAQGVDPSLASGAFRAQYLGAPVPLRSGALGGACTVIGGVGRVVLH